MFAFIITSAGQSLFDPDPRYILTYCSKPQKDTLATAVKTQLSFFMSYVIYQTQQANPDKKFIGEQFCDNYGSKFQVYSVQEIPLVSAHECLKNHNPLVHELSQVMKMLFPGQCLLPVDQKTHHYTCLYNRTGQANLFHLDLDKQSIHQKKNERQTTKANRTSTNS